MLLFMFNISCLHATQLTLFLKYENESLLEITRFVFLEIILERNYYEKVQQNRITMKT